jgi:V/A-type H+-transporting ATPase subunit C
MEQAAVIDFYRYPPIGAEDWRYTFATGRVRSLETTMLPRSAFLDMANADDFHTALDMLSGSDYADMQSAATLGEAENMLLAKRRMVRNLFIDLMIDEDIAAVLRTRHDFANMRLAIRRVVTEKAIGLDYSDFGNVAVEDLEEIFAQENYDRLPHYLREAVEEAVLSYYVDKNIRRIDYAIDRHEARYRIQKACELGGVFLLSLFRTEIDLTNIRTLLRLKLADRPEKDHFLPGGFVETDRFVHGLDVGYEALATLFYATPYHDVVEGGVNYLTSEQSFLRLERLCEEHLMGFLRTTRALAAGPQPVIAYLLMKENEIRTVRMILTCKNNGLDTRLILDRLGE